MRHGAAIFAFVMAGLTSGSACAMTNDVKAPVCVVEGGGKLSADVGPEAICAAVREALAGRPDDAVKVTVRVESPYALTAAIDKGGVTLPEQHFSISDSKLTKSAIDRFARAIAEAVAQAG